MAHRNTDLEWVVVWRCCEHELAWHAWEAVKGTCMSVGAWAYTKHRTKLACNAERLEGRHV
jgi:hypothetical protein